MKNKTKSPIKDKPLRMPGQSLEEERQNLIYDKFLPVFMMTGLAIILAVMEWVRYLNPTRPQPYLFTGIAVMALAYAAWRFLGLREHSRTLRQGIVGEKAVGQFLESLRSKGYSVFHDLIGTGFNIDHVLIGPAGVFTIETKTWSKPIRGEARIKFDGEQLNVAGREPDRNPITQARAQAAWIKTILAESTGHEYDVFPVVVFPGWFIERDVPPI